MTFVSKDLKVSPWKTKVMVSGITKDDFSKSNVARVESAA